MEMCIHTAQPCCCVPETNTTLSISQTIKDENQIKTKTQKEIGKFFIYKKNHHQSLEFTFLPPKRDHGLSRAQKWQRWVSRGDWGCAILGSIFLTEQESQMLTLSEGFTSSTDFDWDTSSIQHDCHFSKMLENIRQKWLARRDAVKKPSKTSSRLNSSLQKAIHLALSLRFSLENLPVISRCWNKNLVMLRPWY